MMIFMKCYKVNKSDSITFEEFILLMGGEDLLELVVESYKNKK